MPAIRAPRTAAVAASVAWLLAAVRPAPAATPTPDRWVAERTEAFATLERARRAASAKSLEAAVRAAAALPGVAVEPLAAPAVAPPAALPPPLSGPVATLLGAVRAAESLARGAIRGEPASLLAAHRRLLRVLAAPRGDGYERLRRGLEPFRRLEGAVNRDRLYAGGLTLAGAIDAALPTLRAAAAALPPPAGAAGCDVADVPGVLCVGGTGPNAHQADYPLLIDLGGDDLHTHAAGAASPLENGLAVSVTLDVGGNDRYETAVPSASGSSAVQAAGLIGGVGFLVDAGGDDIYAATATGQTGALAHAYAVGGFAMLADLDGDDAYRATYLGPASSGQSASGQGLAAFAGAGIVLDAAGDDDYLLDTRPALAVGEDGVLRIGGGITLGFGYGILFGGVGLHADGGGADTMTTRSFTAPLGPEEGRPIDASLGGGAFAEGFGIGIGGFGVAVSGTGPTARTVHAESSAPSSATAVVDGFGFGPFGYGALHDAGGDDVYLAEAISRAVRRAAVDDVCACPGVEAVARSGGAIVHATGESFAGTGILQDAGGNDRYVHSATATAEAEARDDRSRPTPSPEPEGAVEGARAEARTGGATSFGQGTGALGIGVLEDLGGNDRYESRTSSDATAVASAAHPESPTEGVAVSPVAGSSVQALGLGGYGELRDVGGTDLYVSTNASAAAAEPPTEVVPGSSLSFPQAVVFSALGLGDPSVALLTDADAGAGDTFVSVPPYPACVGTRGEGTWRDCGPGAGVGING